MTPMPCDETAAPAPGQLSPSWAQVLLGRPAAQVLLGITVGAVVGTFAECIERHLGHPVITGPYGFGLPRQARLIDTATTGLVEGVIFGGIISVFAALIGLVSGAIRRRATPVGARLIGMVSGTVAALMVSGKREFAESFSGGRSILEWRVVSPLADPLILSVCGAVAGAVVAVTVATWARRLWRSTGPHPVSRPAGCCG